MLYEEIKKLLGEEFIEQYKDQPLFAPLFRAADNEADLIRSLFKFVFAQNDSINDVLRKAVTPDVAFYKDQPNVLSLIHI